MKKPNREPDFILPVLDNKFFFYFDEMCEYDQGHNSCYKFEIKNNQYFYYSTDGKDKYISWTHNNTIITAYDKWLNKKLLED